MNTQDKQAIDIVELMLKDDAFSTWLGLRVIDIGAGFCQLAMQVRPEMANGFKIAHGGIAFAMADSCCSFAVNALGRKSVSVETSINQLKAVQVGDALNCICKQASLGKKLGVYTAEIINHDLELIAIFKGTYYRSEKRWFAPDESETIA